MRISARLSAGEKTAEDLSSGVGSTCRSFLFTVLRSCGTGFCDRLRNHCGRHLMIVICVPELMVEVELAEGVGNAPTSAMPILFSRQVQPAYICLPSGERDEGRALPGGASLDT
jgi:hypothetical protein